jgi:hypothetical protein
MVPYMSRMTPFYQTLGGIKMATPKCNLSTLSELVKGIVKHNTQVAKSGSKNVGDFLTLIVKGAPSTGKTSRIKADVAEMGVRFVTSHPITADPTDYKGLGMAVNGQAEFLPFGDLREWIDATEPTVVLIDDVGQALTAVQNALMQPIRERALNGYQISPWITFVLATNGRKDKAGVTGLTSTLQTRAMIVELVEDHEGFLDWAAGNLCHEVHGFLSYRKDLIYGLNTALDMENTPQYRGWEMVSNLMALRLSNTTEMLGIAGAVGEAAAAEFCGFLRHWRELVNPEDVWADPGRVKVPTEASALYAVVSKVASDVTPEHLPAMIKYVRRCGPEYEVKSYFDIVRLSNSRKDKSLMSNKVFIEWSASATITAALNYLK